MPPFSRSVRFSEKVLLIFSLCLRRLGVSDAGHIRHIGRCEKTRHNISQHYGLLQPFEKQRHHTGAYQDERKVGYQGFK